MPAASAVRYLSSAWHAEAGRNYPAMLAAVTRPNCKEILAVHRTFIRSDGKAKAEVDPPKKTLGPTTGGAIQLAPPGNLLALSEGIETALSFMQATGIPTWAAVSAGNLSHVVLPELPEAIDLIIAGDGDAVGEREAWRAAARFTGLGRRVRVAMAPQGYDFNDLLRE